MRQRRLAGLLAAVLLATPVLALDAASDGGTRARSVDQPRDAGGKTEKVVDTQGRLEKPILAYVGLDVRHSFELAQTFQVTIEKRPKVMSCAGSVIGIQTDRVRS